MADEPSPLIAGAEWPLFGWNNDIRPALETALQAGRPAVLATLFRREGSSPRDPGTQMLFDGSSASGYFSGDCIEADVARHAAEVLADGAPRVLVYGAGSPWIDIRLRCGGSLHIFAERIAPDCAAARELLKAGRSRRPCLWSSDGRDQQLSEAQDAPTMRVSDNPLRIHRRFDPPRRLIVSGGDPIALAVAQLGATSGFETVLIRPDGPETAPPLASVRYIRSDVTSALAELAPDRWTAFVGATHEDHHDLSACAHALNAGAGYVGMIGAKSRAAGRLAALQARGVDTAGLHIPAGLPDLGKAPWEVAVSVLAEVMRAMKVLDGRA
jgi:xanthine dehydrogenase accessory factor